MKYIAAFALILSMIFFSCGVSKISSVRSEEIDKTFSRKDNIKMEFLSGDCSITKSSDDLIHVRVISNVNPSDNFKPLMEEKDNTLELKEVYSGSTKGDVKWILSIPSGVNIKYNSASGNLGIENLKMELNVSVASGDIKIDNSEGSFKVSTASGNITSKNSNGNFKFSTASGYIKVSNSEGTFKLNAASGNVIAENTKGTMKLNSASGNVKALNVTLSETCSFNTASGNVIVKLAASPQSDISINSASGNAILDYNGNTLSGYFELSVKSDNVDIIAPYQFENEKVISKNNDENYLVKTIKIGSDNPKIYISTSSGTVELKK
jgi:hypothetical protein